MCLCRCSQSFTLKSPSHYGSTGSVQFCNSAPDSWPVVRLIICYAAVTAGLLLVSICPSYDHLSSKPGPESCSSSESSSSSRLTRSWSVMFPANVLCVHIHKTVENKGWVFILSSKTGPRNQRLTSKFIFLLILIIILLM